MSADSVEIRAARPDDVEAVLTLWANYVNQPMVLVDLCAYASLALTVISALHYAAYITGLVGDR